MTLYGWSNSGRYFVTVLCWKLFPIFIKGDIWIVLNLSENVDIDMSSYWKKEYIFHHLLSYYSQTCWNDYLCKMTTCLRRPVLSPLKQIPIQLLLYKMIICLTWPATTFFVSQMKKALSKMTTTKFYPAKKWETIIWKQCIKNKCFSDYIYSIATL